MTQNWFASSITEERLLARGGKFTIEFARFDLGWARARLRGTRIEIDAGDRPHTRGMPESIAALLETRQREAPQVAVDPSQHAGWRFHSIRRRRVAVHRGSEPDEQETDLIITTAPAHDHGHVSIVSTPASLGRDTQRLSASLSRTAAHAPLLDSLPLVWSQGSAAVLIHEAIGHPSEHGASRVKWPSWLAVTDDPSANAFGKLAADDCGRPVSLRNLARGERPSALRRWTFRDTPIIRMSNLVVAAAGKPAALPPTRIEVLLVENGSWDPLTDEVSLRVSLAELVDGHDRRLLPRFTVRATRAELASRITGWHGDAVRYPGVICSDEGQSLPVGSISVGLVTRAR